MADPVLTMRATVVADQALAEFRKLGAGAEELAKKGKTHTTTLNKEFQALQKTLQGMGGDLVKAGFQLASAFRGAGGIAAGIVTAASAATYAVTKMAREINDLSRAAKNLGLSERDFRAFGVMAEKAGSNVQTMAEGLTALQRNIGGLKFGLSDAMKEEFGGHGGGWFLDALKGAKSLEEQYELVINLNKQLMEKDPSGALSAKLAQTVGMDPALLRNANMEDFKKAQNALTGRTEEEKQAAKNLTDRVTDLVATANDVMQQIGAKIIVGLDAVMRPPRPGEFRSPKEAWEAQQREQSGAPQFDSPKEAWEAGTPHHFAVGGIVNRPMIGLLGEAGPEAIIPLKGAGDSNEGERVVQRGVFKALVDFQSYAVGGRPGGPDGGGGFGRGGPGGPGGGPGGGAGAGAGPGGAKGSGDGSSAATAEAEQDTVHGSEAVGPGGLQKLQPLMEALKEGGGELKEGVIGGGSVSRLPFGTGGAAGAAPGGPGGSVGSTQTGETGKAGTAATVAAAWRKAGMSEAGIAGVLANIEEESKFDPTLRHADQPKFSGEAHFAHGLYQEGGDEWNNYSKWLGGRDWKDPALQSQFAAENLKAHYPKVWAQMNQGDKQQAAAAYVRGYLKPAKQYQASRVAKFQREGVPDVSAYTKSQPIAPSGATAAGPTAPAGSLSGSGGTKDRASAGRYNYFQSLGAEPVRDPSKLTTVATEFGKVQVNPAAAADFKAMTTALAAAGAPIKKFGSYNLRQKRWGGGWSSHAYASAFDVDDAAALSPKMKAWIRANPEKWKAALRAGNMGQPLTDATMTGGKDAPHVEWRGPRAPGQIATPATPAPTRDPYKDPSMRGHVVPTDRIDGAVDRSTGGGPKAEGTVNVHVQHNGTAAKTSAETKGDLFPKTEVQNSRQMQPTRRPAEQVDIRGDR